jgi:GNAT superfamily N-acetyltransferase
MKMNSSDSINITKSTPEEKDYLDKKITEFNSSKVPFTQKDPHIHLGYTIKDESNNILGGITAVLYCWGCLYVDVLWIAENYRGQQLGSLLIDKVESKAKELGCKIAHLDTFDFQAKDFYIKKGYELFGELDNCPPNHKRFYLKKEFKTNQADFNIRPLELNDFNDLDLYFGVLTEYKNPVSKWEGYFNQQQSGERFVRVIEINDHVVGLATLKLTSDYPYFQTNNIPEIKDLLVYTAYQKRGFGRALVHALEIIAKELGHSKVGIAFGLYQSYGSAQRLYIKMGYQPDGQGITYHSNSVVPGESYPVDDELLLWLTKSI